MTDRELLELAARAAGQDYRPDSGVIVVGGIPGNWNPLTDDGDALRLAVTLGLDILHSPGEGLHVFLSGDGEQHLASQMYGHDPHEATRRAIVRAAAEIGSRME